VVQTTKFVKSYLSFQFDIQSTEITDYWTQQQSWFGYRKLRTWFLTESTNVGRNFFKSFAKREQSPTNSAPLFPQFRILEFKFRTTRYFYNSFFDDWSFWSDRFAMRQPNLSLPGGFRDIMLTDFKDIISLKIFRQFVSINLPELYHLRINPDQKNTESRSPN